MNRIAVVDQSLKLHVTDIDGANVVTVDAPGNGQTWPVWSATGERLAFSSVSPGSNGHGRLELHSWSAEDGRTDLIYKNESGTDAIARRTPHYAQWSPNGLDVSFIAQTSDGTLTLLARTVGATDPPKRILAGNPLFSSWSPDGLYLLVHSNADHYLVDRENGDRVTEIPAASPLYAAPSWSPVENQLALLRQTGEERQALIVGDTRGGSAALLTEFSGNGAFSWAPHGRSIALARDLDARSRFYPGLWIIEYDGKGERQVPDEHLICFYWSPDGSRIAYVTPSRRPEGWMRWAVLDLALGTSRYLGDFLPTEEQLTMILFFDQYSQSHSPWSPDGRTLIFAGSVSGNGQRLSLPETEEASVFVVDAGGLGPATPVARGPLGVWARGAAAPESSGAR